MAKALIREEEQSQPWVCGRKGAEPWTWLGRTGGPRAGLLQGFVVPQAVLFPPSLHGVPVYIPAGETC